MRKGDIKQGRVLTRKVAENITFKQLVEEYLDRKNKIVFEHICKYLIGIIKEYLTLLC
jgi:hypothetical protein